MFHKKGVSPLVATILLILITITSVGIIFVAIMPMIDKATKNAENMTAFYNCLNQTAREYCESLNMTFQRGIQQNDFVEKYEFFCANERKLAFQDFYFTDKEVEKCGWLK
jgi:flagellin-like protein